MSTNLTILPNLILLKIISYCSYYEICNLYDVSSKFNKLITTYYEDNYVALLNDDKLLTQIYKSYLYDNFGFLINDLYDNQPIQYFDNMLKYHINPQNSVTGCCINKKMTHFHTTRDIIVDIMKAQTINTIDTRLIQIMDKYGCG